MCGEKSCLPSPKNENSTSNAGSACMRSIISLTGISPPASFSKNGNKILKVTHVTNKLNITQEIPTTTQQQFRQVIKYRCLHLILSAKKKKKQSLPTEIRVLCFHEAHSILSKRRGRGSKFHT